MGQEVPLLDGFHPLGNDRQTQALTQGHDRPGKGGIVGIGEYIADEGLIDLQLVEGQVLQVGERGVSGAEVVQGEPFGG